jgi:KDO2-lipid IV(A) lauroyltransferase
MIASQLLKGVSLWFLFYPLRWAVQCLSWRFALKIGVMFATLHARCLADQLQRRIREGIQTIWGDELSTGELNRLVRGNLITRYKHLIDTFFYQHLDEELIEQVIPTIQGRSYLDGVLKSGNGVILLVSHFGSFGLLVGGLMLRGYQLQQIFTLTPQSPYRTWRWVERAIMQAKLACWRHDRVGFTFWRPGMYLRPLYRKLRDREILVVYGDGARGQGFTQVDFMGYPLSLSTGPFKIAARTQAALIPAFVLREPDDRHRIILEEPMMLNDDTASSLQQGARQYAALLERYVRAYPDHWFSWARLRWTRQPGCRWLELSPSSTTPSEFYHTEESRLSRR